MLVLHLERGLTSPEWQEALADRLAPLRREARIVDLVAAHAPSLFFASGASAPGESLAGARLASLLAAYRVVPPSPAELGPAGAPLRDARLARECRATPRLRGIAAELDARPDLVALSDEAVIDAVGEAAAAHYRAVWGELSDDERITLIHIAGAGFVSPRAWPSVRRLMRRGLVVRAPAVRVMNESFRRFVQRAETPAMIAAWQRETRGSGAWIRDAVIAAVVLVALGLFLARPDAIGSWVAFFTALATVGARATDVLTFLQGGQKPAKS